MKKKTFPLAIYFLIFLLAAFLRLVGNNWDQDQHLHPDERFLTMVANALKPPLVWTDYFDTDSSTLNPHNVGFGFYVYGTFPLHTVTLVSHLLHQSDYIHLTLVGRFISALIDLLTLLFVILIAHKISGRKSVSMLAGFFYAVAVLPIQLSHFFAVEPFLNLFTILSLYLLVHLLNSNRNSVSIIYSLLLGMSFGLAVSSKVVALLLLPPIGLVFLVRLIKTKKLLSIFIIGFVFIISSSITLRLAFPYLFSASGILPTGLNPKVLTNWKELESYNQPNFYYPPSVGWTHTPSYIFPLENMLLYGWGVPLFTLVCLGFVYSVYLIRKNTSLIPLVSFFLVYFIYEGQSYALPMRYFYPLYPILAVFGSMLTSQIVAKITLTRTFLLLAILFLGSIWPLSFISIYQTPHTRITASEWIYNNIPLGSSISCEYWDDCLPLNLPDYPVSSIYTTHIYSLYDSESPEKWQQINTNLDHTDYIILTSNRLYGSIMTAPEHYPDTSEFYHRLFTGNLGFSPVAQFTSRPNLPVPFMDMCITPPGIKYGKISSLIQTCDSLGLTFVDDYADETLTVYDHPKVIIFKRNNLNSVN